jgi:SAM-dependent methyltransferase
MKIFEYLLERPLLFNLSQIPFTRQKFARVLKHNDLKNVRNVLDVGCGAGSNTRHFAHTNYLGVDVNPRYIRMAQRRYQRQFLVADVTKSQELLRGSYDFILLNSFLHHIDDASARQILEQSSQLLAIDGCAHSIELVLPEKRGLPRWLARRDRGKFPRPLSCWKDLFELHLRTIIFEPFSIYFMGTEIMELVYFKGRKKT